jgi:primosomal protein N' (replication factor Y)
VGLGTERLEDALAREFPGVPVARLDRDSTQRKDSAARVLEDVRSGHVRILAGTQMLTKGHDFPGVSLVAVLDADHGLFGTDFRSSERLAQTLTQVAGRAGRRETRGEVLIQTSCPDHPLLSVLLTGGYEAFAAQALVEREASGWPPYSHLALLRAEAPSRPAPTAFLEVAARHARAAGQPVQVLGPVPATMERRAGRVRAQLLLQARSRPALHRVLDHMLARLENEKASRGVRWHVDVDPVDLL